MAVETSWPHGLGKVIHMTWVTFWLVVLVLLGEFVVMFSDFSGIEIPGCVRAFLNKGAIEQLTARCADFTKRLGASEMEVVRLHGDVLEQQNRLTAADADKEALRLRLAASDLEKENLRRALLAPDFEKEKLRRDVAASEAEKEDLRQALREKTQELVSLGTYKTSCIRMMEARVFAGLVGNAVQWGGLNMGMLRTFNTDLGKKPNPALTPKLEEIRACYLPKITGTRQSHSQELDCFLDETEEYFKEEFLWLRKTVREMKAERDALKARSMLAR